MITIEQIRKLNAERTQGEWLYYERPSRDCGETLTGAGHYNEIYSAVVTKERLENNIDEDGDKLESQEGVIADNGQYYSVSVESSDCKFIAAAPAIAELAIKQSEEIEALKHLLEICSQTLKISKNTIKTLNPEKEGE